MYISKCQSRRSQNYVIHTFLMREKTGMLFYRFRVFMCITDLLKDRNSEIFKVFLTIYINSSINGE